MNGTVIRLGLVLILGVLPVLPVKADGTASADERAFRDQVVPLLNHYCVRCHGPEKTKGKVDLSKVGSLDDMVKSRELWAKVVENVDAGIMPPDGDMPTEEEVKRIVNVVQSTLSNAGCKLDEPGRVTLRRLNRAEYNNTVRDLLGVSFQPAADFPVDDVGYGFDNIGDVLTLPPLLMEKYLNAAEKVAESAIQVPERSFGASRKRLGRDLKGAGESKDPVRGLYSRGTVFTEFDLPEDGSYQVLVRAYGDQAGDEPPKMALKLDGQDVQTFDVLAASALPETFEVRMPLKAGKHKVELTFLNDYFQKDAPENRRDRNLFIESVDLQGPATPPMWKIADLKGRDFQGGGESGSNRNVTSGEGAGPIANFPSRGITGWS